MIREQLEACMPLLSAREPPESVVTTDHLVSYRRLLSTMLQLGSMDQTLTTDHQLHRLLLAKQNNYPSCERRVQVFI